MTQQTMTLESIEVRPEEIARKQSLGAAIELCAELAGFSLDKELQQTLEVDKGQFSRWQSGQEGIKWEKFAALMDVCGNDAPLLWMLPSEAMTCTHCGAGKARQRNVCVLLKSALPSLSAKPR